MYGEVSLRNVAPNSVQQRSSLDIILPNGQISGSIGCVGHKVGQKEDKRSNDNQLLKTRKIKSSFFDPAKVSILVHGPLQHLHLWCCYWTFNNDVTCKLLDSQALCYVDLGALPHTCLGIQVTVLNCSCSRSCKQRNGVGNVIQDR